MPTEASILLCGTSAPRRLSLEPSALSPPPAVLCHSSTLHQGDDYERLCGNGGATSCPLVRICRESRLTASAVGEASDSGRLKGD